MCRSYRLHMSAVLILFVIGCSSATLKSFVNPSIDPESIQSVAIFPIRNIRLLTDEARELNRSITQAFHDCNPTVEILGPSEAIDKLNDADLAAEYSDFLRDYATSGIPNAKTLQQIGNALGVDAILQGEVFDLKQIDGNAMYGVKGKTSLTVRYSLMSTSVGDVLWEATSNAKKQTATVLQSAPPLYEAILIAQERILTALPRLGK